MHRLRGSACASWLVFALACGDEARATNDPTTAGTTGSGADDGITSLTTVISTGVSVGDDDPGASTGIDSTSGSEDDTSSTGGSSGGPAAESTESSAGETTAGGGITIYDIQQDVVPIGSMVEVNAVIVTGVAPAGFFVQEPAGGEWSGIFVYTAARPAVSVGDEVDVMGTTAEQDGLTEITTAMGGAVNPTGETGVVLSPDVVALSELADRGSAEPWESVVVRIEADALDVVALPGFSELDVSDGVDTVRIDNFLYDALADSPSFPGLAVGTGFSAIQGPLNYSFGAFKIAPRSATDLEGYVGPPPPDWTAVDALSPGDLVITEVMYNPSCDNDDCEWIEVWNATGGNVNLAGLRIQDSALGQECTIDPDVIVPAGGYAWLSTDDAGGWPYAAQPDAFCTGAFPGFNNSSSDSAAILNATGPIDQTAAYTDDATGNGRSWKLAPGSLSAAANDQAGNWCYSTVQFDAPGGTSEYGSPGAANEAACAP